MLFKFTQAYEYYFSHFIKMLKLAAIYPMKGNKSQELKKYSTVVLKCSVALNQLLITETQRYTLTIITCT